MDPVPVSGGGPEGDLGTMTVAGTATGSSPGS